MSDPAQHSRLKDAALLLVALSLGLAIAWMDSRPHWDDTGITAASLLLSGGLSGLMGPRQPWRWGLAVGVWVPLTLIVRAPAVRSVAGGLVILAIPMAGAYAGMALRRMAAAWN